MQRRQLIRHGAALAGAVAAGPGSWLLAPGIAQAAQDPIRIGLPTDLSGALAVAGVSMVNTAKMQVAQINAAGGILGRPVELLIEDTATNEATGVTVSRKLVQRDKVDVVIGGVTSSMRNAIKDVVTKRGNTLYIYPQLYEGGECTRDLLCTGATPQQLIDPLVAYLTKTGAKRFALPGSDYVFPHTFDAYARDVIARSGGEVVYEDYFAVDQSDFSAPVARMLAARPDVVLSTVIPPGMSPLFKRIHESGFQKNGGRMASVFHDDRLLKLHQPEEVEGLVAAYDYFRAVDAIDPASARIQAEYDKMNGDPSLPAAGSLMGSVYRAVALYASAVREAGSTEHAKVAAALDHARIAEGPGGGAEVVPGKHHCRIHTYIGVVKNGSFAIAERSAGLLDPGQC